jgi:hypothetical protein
MSCADIHGYITRVGIGLHVLSDDRDEEWVSECRWEGYDVKNTTSDMIVMCLEKKKREKIDAEMRGRLDDV